ncbi:ankyrin, partial [Massarina eburnea CBS 473.64]
MCTNYEEVSLGRDRYRDEPPLTTYNEENDGPITLATKSGHTKVVETLLEINGISLNERGKDGWLPIHHAAHLGHGNCVNMLLSKDEKVADLRVDVTNETPLMLACANPHINSNAVIIKLLRVAPNINAKDYTGRTAIMHAAETGSLFILEKLLEQPNVDYNLMDDQERTMFFHLVCRDMNNASEWDQEHILKLLHIMQGHGLSSKTAGDKTILMAMAESRNHLFLQTLLSRDDPYVQDSINAQNVCGRTALSYAISNDHKDMVELFLSQDSINLGLQDEDGETALSLACDIGMTEIARLLLNHP